MKAAAVGQASGVLGAGREKKEDVVNHAAGILLYKKTGEFVHCGDVLAELHTDDAEKFAQAEALFLSALTFSDEKPEKKPLICGVLR